MAAGVAATRAPTDAGNAGGLPDGGEVTAAEADAVASTRTIAGTSGGCARSSEGRPAIIADKNIAPATPLEHQPEKVPIAVVMRCSLSSLAL